MWNVAQSGSCELSQLFLGGGIFQTRGGTLCNTVAWDSELGGFCKRNRLRLSSWVVLLDLQRVSNSSDRVN